ncbi:CGLD27 family protein [Dactylococcopsis salina]|uniref:Uncharacterized protein n=1 Tax=Dactylococcopsis salina (strain PCC 8305) TaxID=13035 RepID=K9YUE4_DACS8|nr:CGLD27 family protein [Dactylococcopsis salina]AFZ50524.1 Protein of unknown function (DUF1230) [Dactylococcopsis salina PCC 8305]
MISQPCPVPPEQLPLNEYEKLKTDWPFRWVTFSRDCYIRKLLWTWGWGWVMAGPLTVGSFPLATHPYQFFLCGALGASLLVVFMVVRLYLGWSYVRNRLEKAAIPYEESGWYDGQTWEKPDSVLRRDRLVVSYQITPIFKRLQITALVLVILSAIDLLAWRLLTYFL